MSCRAILGTTLAAGGVVLADALLGPQPLTLADHVTRTRLTLVTGAGSALLVLPPRPSARDASILAAALSLGVALDAVDGAVARRTGTCTERGARFDMESDAVAVAVLSVLGARTVGPWALIPGALRYGYVGARAVVPALRRPLEFRASRRWIAGASMAAMSLAAWPQLPDVLRRGLLAGSTLALCYSFGRDIRGQLTVTEQPGKGLSPATAASLR